MPEIARYLTQAACMAHIEMENLHNAIICKELDGWFVIYLTH